MTGDSTTRDRVWSAALGLASEVQYFEVGDVLEAADLDESNRRTVRRTLHAMRELDWLAPSSPGVISIQRWSDGPRLDRSTEEAEGVSEENRRPSAEGDEIEEVPEEDRELLGRVTARVTEVAAERGILKELDVPGRGEVAEQRRRAVAAVVEHLQDEGRAQKGDLVEIGAEIAGETYADSHSLWKNLMQPALSELEGVESEGASGYWRRTDL